MKDDFSYTPLAQIMSKIKVKNTKKTTTSKMRISQESSREASFMCSASTFVDSDEESQMFLCAVQAATPSKKNHSGVGYFSVQDAIASQDVWHMKTKKLSQKRVKCKKNHTNELEHVHICSARENVPSIAVDNTPDNEDSAIFLQAMGGVDNLGGKGRAVVPAVQPTATLQPAEDALQEFMDGKCEFALALTGEYMEGFVVGLDKQILERLRAGQYSPEAHLDLHGLNAVQAYRALVNFFRGAWYKGLRSVLLVPGRGKNSPNGISVLKDKLQLWLTQEPFKRVVLAFCTARPVDGGPGSVYVLLRRYRKKGKIHWERVPVDTDIL